MNELAPYNANLAEEGIWITAHARNDVRERFPLRSQKLSDVKERCAAENTHNHLAIGRSGSAVHRAAIVAAATAIVCNVLYLSVI